MPKDKDSSAPPPAAPKKKSEQKVERRTVRVRATKLGFYGHMLRPPGTIFNIKIAADEKWPSWVEELSESDSPDTATEPKTATGNEQNGSSSDDVI